jgi:hypothetical protein
MRRRGWPLLLVCLLLAGMHLSASAEALSTHSASRTTARDVATLPADFQELSSLTCPSAGLCVGLAFPNDYVFAVGTGDRTTWTLTPVPRPAGVDLYVFGVACTTPSFCYAWGEAGSPTVWFSTDPASGVWQRQVIAASTDNHMGLMTCPTTTLCVAGTAPDQNGTDPGAAWFTQNPLGGSATWTSSPLDSIYRAGPIDCSGVMCVITGQSRTYSVNASLWATNDVRAGGWTRVDPVSPSGGVDGLRRVQCLSTAFCAVNALVTSGDGASVFLHMGYFVSTAPTSGVWDWHEFSADAYSSVGPLYCKAVGECLAYGYEDLFTDPDPTDSVAAVPVQIAHQYPLNLKGITCFDANTCQVWGSDSGAASAGVLYTTRVWRGSPSGGAWTGTALPLPAGHPGEVPEAYELSCSSASSCTAVGAVTSPDYPFYATIAPVVWTSGADGIWHVMAAGYGSGNGGGGGQGSVTKVATSTSIGVKRSVTPHRLKGKVTALHGCQKARRVKVIGKLGAPVVRVKSDLHGRWSVPLTKKVRSHLGRRVRVKISEKWRGTTIRCLAASSARIRW